ncbi:chloramphenicol acetyltransferase [Prevotella sp. 10(H)]|uniref:chloramphenicol acetyltransferase n=1 Tax=Prevotella sp. 10(H) TaxID=1158294 RepID=UPI0004A6DB8F|nr:chloramphenicol acetyltransferase [Prevotella sp. 10(H)]
MKTLIDIEDWNRKEHFYFFKAFDDPFFGMTTNVDFTPVYEHSTATGTSFFLNSLHRIMQAVNAVELFRYRIEGEQLFCYDIIHPASTIGREDGTFSFSFFEYDTDIDIFRQNASDVIRQIQHTSGIGMDENALRNDVIHYSSVPWVQFTEMKHTMSLGSKGSIPKISTGKLFREEQKMMMPVSITVNHAVMDGLHVGQFLGELNEQIHSD